MTSCLEHINVANNNLYDKIPPIVCNLPYLMIVLVNINNYNNFGNSRASSLSPKTFYSQYPWKTVELVLWPYRKSPDKILIIVFVMSWISKIILLNAIFYFVLLYSLLIAKYLVEKENDGEGIVLKPIKSLKTKGNTN